MRRAMGLCALAACACGDAVGPASTPEAPTGTPVARLNPPAQLDLGDVVSDAVARGTITLTNEGTGPLEVSSVEVVGPRPDVWGVVVPSAPVPPGASADLVVEYLPCPGVWAEPPELDVCACPSRVDAAILQIVTNASDEPSLISLGAVARPIGPRLGLDPPARLDFGGAATATVSISNQGCEALELARLLMVGPGASLSESVDDFAVAGCRGWPCAPNLSLEPGEVEDLGLRYDNDDLVSEDIVELRFTSNDPVQPVRTLLVTAQGTPSCLPPVPIVEGGEACVGQAVELSARASRAPDGGRITRFDWRILFSQRPAPLTISADTSTASFVPDVQGLYLVQVEVHTDCGPPGAVVYSTIVEADCN